MSKTPFSNKVEILGNLWFFYKEQAESNEQWSEFFEWADMGLPMAYMAWREMVAIKADGKKFIEDTWDVLCEILSVDPNARYSDIDQLFDASPNEPINAEG